MSKTVVITDEPGVTETIEAVDTATGVDWSADLVLGNTVEVVTIDDSNARVPDGGIGVDEDGRWHMSREDYAWWCTYIERHILLEAAKGELSDLERERFECEFPRVDMEDEHTAGWVLIAEIIKDRGE